MLIYFGRYVMQELGDGHYYWDILLSREMKQVADESFVFTGQHTGASCVQHSPTAAAWHYFTGAVAPHSPELDAIDHKI